MSIIEMVVVLVASALLTLQGIKEDIAHRRATLLAAEGQNEATINQALGSWVTDNYATLLAQYNPANPQPLTPPTIAGLFAAGNLKQPHSNGPFWGGVYVIQMAMVPAGCSPSAGNCHVSYTLYPSLPIMRNGQPDVTGASEIAQAGGAAFGFSKTQNSGTITGLNGAWTAANPLAGSPAAAILATNANPTDGNSVYIRRDGSLTWTGDQNVNGVSLHNVKNLDATGNISAATANLQAGNALNIGGGAIYYGDPTNAAIRTSGALYLQNLVGSAPADLAEVGNINASGKVTAGSSISAGTTITTGNVAWPRTACAKANDMGGAADNSGLVLSCQNLSGVLQWMPIGGPKLWYGYTAIPSGGGTFVPAPACPAGGTPGILVTGQSTYTDPTAAINYPTVGVGPWTVYITDGSGTVIPGTAVASTYCSY